MPSVLVTGANRGLGLEFTRQYAAAGWSVIAACRRPADFPQLDRYAVELVGLDVADPQSVADLAAHLAGRPLDLLINNAGVYGEQQDLGAIDPVEWERVLRTNVIGPLKMAEAFLPHLRAGEKKTIAFLTSRLGSIADNADGGIYIYRSSKAALNAAAKSLAVDLKGQGMTVLLLHPGWARTAMGGAAAPVAPADSVTGLRRLIDRAGPVESGRFFDYTGEELPW